MPGYTLTWKHVPTGTLDASALRPDLLGRLDQGQLAQQPIRAGRRRYSLGDLFTIAGEPGDTLAIPGSECYLHLAQGMKSGTLQVHGHAGDLAGIEMNGGYISIDGNAGDSLGASMFGGRISVRGNTGARCGGPSPNRTEGMSGGEILIAGRAGPHCGLRMRAGLIACHEADAYPGEHMLAGTILVRHGNLDTPGLSLRRGTIITLDSMIKPNWTPAYQPDCIYQPVFLMVLLGHLARSGFAIPDEARHGRYQLYSGDRLVLGKGEILQLIQPSLA